MDWFLRRYGAVFYAPEGEGGGAGGGAGDDGAGGGNGQGPPAGGDGKPKTYDEAYVKQLRDEAAGNRTKLRDLEKKLEGFESEKLTESEKLKKRAEEAEGKLTASETRVRARLLKAEVTAVASTLKFHDAEAALALIQGKVEYDEEGEPKDVKKHLEQLAKDKPWMIQGEDRKGSGGPANPAGNRGGGNAGKPGRPSWSGAFKD